MSNMEREFARAGAMMKLLRPRYFVVSRDVPDRLPPDWDWPYGWPKDWAKVDPDSVTGFVIYAPLNYVRWSLESVIEQMNGKLDF